jgi:maltose alpha-D-glucosyltransferase/alpha-amylase
LALADSTDRAFAPEPIDEATLSAMADGMQRRAAAALDLLQQRLADLSDAARVQAEAVIGARRKLLAQFEGMRRSAPQGFRIRVHGDYHLGQVLRTEEDFVILDFEGEPARPLAERREKQPPLKDVAGMVRSFSYAAYAALLAFSIHSADSYRVLEPWADTWQHWASRSFLAGYRATMAQSGLVPQDPAFFAMLDTLVLDKALYELGYELNNRPDWIRIPLTGILKLANRLQS